VAFLVMMAVGAVLFSSTQLLPQLLQTNFQYTALLSGLALMPGGLAMLVMMPVSGLVASRLQPKYLMAASLGGVALSMWASTALTQEASFSFFAWIRVWQMIGLPFLFIPINTVAYSGLPADKTNEASALINVARNLGGSIGVSLTNTELARRAQFHQARLVEHAYPSSPVYQDTTRQLSDFFAGQGDAPALRSSMPPAGSA
jgi:MFS transporter, DHA2 family, multidrug resistance protein